jgi:cytochrome c-type biogenesis protein CcmH
MATELAARDTSSAPARRRALGLPGWVSPLALVVVVAVALAIGGGLFSGGPPSAVQRTAALEAQVRCPSCEDLSVAQSSASTAIALRHQIARQVRQGQSDQAIENGLVARYGPTILLRPPARGLAATVYVVPAVAGAVAVGALGVLFWRRSKEMTRLRQRGTGADDR